MRIGETPYWGKIPASCWPRLETHFGVEHHALLGMTIRELADRIRNEADYPTSEQGVEDEVYNLLPDFSTKCIVKSRFKTESAK